MARSPDDRLDSWKAIAAYLDRTVRTVRRWEREEGLPVHRHQHQVLGSVYAYKSEIDRWQLDRKPPAAEGPAAPRRGSPARGPMKSIAVLPFANVSTDPENEYFADGLTDEVTADLSKISGFRVISRTSAMTFKRSTKDVRTIARALGVEYILEGSVRRAGDRLRITAQLIDAARDDHLWADKYEGPVSDVFAIQQRLSLTIVNALAVRLTPDDERRLDERPILDLRAYECYLRARQEAWRWRRDAIDRAVRLLEDGLEIVGDHARLHAALGHAWLQYREAAIDVSERPLAEAERCAAKVIALEGESAGALQLRGWIRYGRGRIQEAVYDLRSALDRDPNNADTLLLLVNCYLISGQMPAARPLIDRLESLDPITPVSHCMRAFADAMEGDSLSAIEPYRRMFEMDPGNPMARLFYIWALALNDRREDIRPVLATFASDVRDTIPARLAQFLSHALDGDAESAQAAVRQDLTAIETAPDMFPRMLAQGYAMCGEADRALRWLSLAVDRGFINYPFLSRFDPFLRNLRRTPAFRTLLKRVRDRWERFET